MTDANLVLGRLDPDAYCGGRIRLHPDAARASVCQIGAEFGWSDIEAAHAIVTIAVANVADSIRLQTVARGHDPREFSLVAFGGAGPLHAALIAHATSIPEVIIPCEPGTFSSVGLLAAERGCYTQAAYLKPVGDVDPADLTLQYQALEAAGRQMLAAVASAGRTRIERTAAMRYMLQEWEIKVPIPDEAIDPVSLREIRESFDRLHHTRYGFARPDQPVEFVTLFANAVAEGNVFDFERRPITADHSKEPMPGGRRPVYVDADVGIVEVPVYERPTLTESQRLPGPCVVEEPTATTFVPSRWIGIVDDFGNIIMTHNDDGT